LAALGLAGLIGWWTQYRKPASRAAARPTVAILPFEVVGRRTPLIDLDSVLPPAFAWQLQMLPEYRVIAPAVVNREILRRFGAEPVSIDTMLQMARGLGATRVVWGRAESCGIVSRSASRCTTLPIAASWRA